MNDQTIEGMNIEEQSGAVSIPHLQDPPDMAEEALRMKREPDIKMDPQSYEGNMSILMGVKLSVAVELGRTNLSVKEVLELQKGSVVELDRIAGEAVDIFVNDSLIARGDVVVVDDKFGVRVTELIPIEKSVV